jgi:hypothetical protein
MRIGHTLLMILAVVAALVASSARAQAILIGPVRPCTQPVAQNCDLLTGYTMGEFMHSQTPEVWPQMVAISYSWAAREGTW